MTTFAIPVRFDSFLTYYPTFSKTPVTANGKTTTLLTLQDPGRSLRGELDGWVTKNFNDNVHNTTCCIQMSHAINMAFYTTDPTKMIGLRSTRPRDTHGAAIKSLANRVFHYVAAVDEMKGFLTAKFGPGEQISSRDDIDDRPGIVVFMGHETYGIHTEIWTGDNYHQDFIKGNFAALTKPEVLFWSIGDPNLIDI
jgi:hypothetical protein